MPIADGGDGTLDICVSALNLDLIELPCVDALGAPLLAPCGIAPASQLAVIEAANIVGLKLIGNRELRPLATSTVGLGLCILRLLDAGYRRFILGLGGSAVIDAGAGCMSALGVRLLGARGKPVPPNVVGLADLECVDISHIDTRLSECTFTLACDTDLPLVGESGGLRTFGRQKGLRPNETPFAEYATGQWVRCVAHATGRNLAMCSFGACNGGTAYALMNILGARPIYGADWMMELLHFDDAARHCELVITGEGKLDRSTESGKGPVRVALRARQLETSAVAIVATLEEDISTQTRNLFSAIEILSSDHDLVLSKEHTIKAIERTAYQIGRDLDLKRNI